VYIGNDASPENWQFFCYIIKEDLDFGKYHQEENLGSISLVQQQHRCIDFNTRRGVAHGMMMM
jgi:hypothetical protein